MSGFIVQEPKSNDHNISGLKNRLYPTGDSNRAWGFGLCTIPGSRGKRTPPNIQEGKNRGGVRWLAAAELARRGSTGPGAGPARARPVLASPSEPYINRPNPVPVRRVAGPLPGSPLSLSLSLALPAVTGHPGRAHGAGATWTRARRRQTTSRGATTSRSTS